MTNWISGTGNSLEKLPQWDYKVDPKIEGVITAKRLDVTPKKLCFYDIETDKGEKKSILGSVVINKVLRNLPVGSLVRITYLGDAKNGSGTTFHNFEVEYDKDSVPVDVDVSKITEF